MLIYIANFISAVFYNAIIKNKIFFVTLISLQLFLILALRDNNLGVDLVAYHEIYHYIGTFSWQNLWSRLHFISTAELASLMDIESGYVLFNWVIYQLGFSFHGFLVICAFFSIAPVGIFIYRYSLSPVLSFLIYISTNLYFYNFGILRQSLAIGILLFSVPFILNRRWLITFLLIAFAFTFHRAALLWVPICILFFFRLNRKRFLFLCVVAFIMLGIFNVFGTNFLGPLLSLFGKDHYMINQFAANNMIILLFITAFLLYMLCDISTLSKIPIYNLLIWGLVLCLYFEVICTYTPLARALPIVLIFITVLLPNMINLPQYHLTKDKTKILRFLITEGLSCFLFLYMILQLMKDQYIVPYRFY